MDAMQRRQQVRQVIGEAEQPVSASALAKRLGVSRQVIVGDVALLRAEGCDIISTARGYLCPKAENTNCYLAKLACFHDKQQTRDELYTVVDMGGSVLDVIVEHPIYGQLTGPLQISNRHDVQQFIRRCQEADALPLSRLTDGIHLHTLSCPDEASLERVRESLRKLGILFER